MLAIFEPKFYSRKKFDTDQHRIGSFFQKGSMIVKLCMYIALRDKKVRVFRYTQIWKLRDRFPDRKINDDTCDSSTGKLTEN